MLKRLQSRWKLRSRASVVRVLVVFSLAGLAILPTRKWLYTHWGIDAEMPLRYSVLLWLAVVFPLYQIFLLAFGAVFGEFAFFWEKERRLAEILLRFLGRPFRRALLCRKLPIDPASNLR